MSGTHNSDSADSPPPRPAGHARFLLYPLIFAGTAVRLATPFFSNPMDALGTDPGRHWRNALEPTSFGPMQGIDPIGYQLWLGAIAKLTIGDRVAIALYAGILSAFMAWFWYRFARELFPSKPAALLCWALVAWLPSWISIYSYFMTETLLLALMGLALWMSWRALRKQTTAAMVAALLCWLAACETRVVVLPIAIIAMAAILHHMERAWSRTALALVIVAIVVAPPAYRAKKIIGVPALFGYPMMNTVYRVSGAREIDLHFTKANAAYAWSYGFASPTMDTEPLAPFSHWRSPRKGIADVHINLDKGARDWDTAVASNWVGWKKEIAQEAEGTIFLLLSPSWPDNDPGKFWDAAQSHLRWMWTPLFALTVAWNLIAIRRERHIHLLPLLSLALWASLLLPAAVAEGRYRKPAEGLTLINIVWLFSRRGERDARGTNLGEH